MPAKLTCSHCGADNAVEYDRCWKCKRPLPVEARDAIVAAAKEADHAAEQAALHAKANENERRAMAEAAFVDGRISEIPADLLKGFAPRVIVCTTPTPLGHEVEAMCGIITAECVFGMNAIKELFMATRSAFGGRSETAEAAFKEATEICLDTLRERALSFGANGVVSVALNYGEVTEGKSMLFLVASGTAVKLKR